ncbi:MAG: DUF2029 domain-containing protein [Hyphomonadaceae bacterium]|nr:DUF2029 domain-containing protein [Hyphomonadaceae bacterium]
MALRFEINEDEFYNLNMGYEFARGEVGNPVQTLMFRFSGWLDVIPGQEIEKIVAGRMLALVAVIATCGVMYKVSRRYFSTPASLFAILTFFGFNFVFRHLTAFRVDAFVTLCLMLTLLIVSDPQQSWRKVVIAGLLIGIAFSLTLKSIFYMPIVAVFLMGRWVSTKWSRKAFWHGLTMLFVALAIYGIVFVLHDPQGFSLDDSLAYLREISNDSLLVNETPKTRSMFFHSLLRSFTGWGLVVIGFVVLVSQLLKNNIRSKWQTIALLSFAFPITTVIYYNHSYPYLYPFMLAPAMIVIAAAIERFFVEQKSDIFFFLICFYAIIPIAIFGRSMFQNNEAQRTTIAAVHQIFPVPVPTIDCCGMIASFDRINEVGWFINPDIFGHLKYIDADIPIMREIVKTHKPVLILANADSLDVNQGYNKGYPYRLLEEDFITVKNNYQRFWGPIYIPGKQIFENGPIEILMAGTYTFKGPENVLINGQTLANGDTIDLPMGEHEISELGPEAANLIWGDNLRKPNLPEPTKPLFNGF